MRVFFLATRVAGNDGVTLEAKRWREILERMGHKVTFVAGELDTDGLLIPELHFRWPRVVELHDKVVWSNNNYQEVEAEIFELAGRIEGRLREIFNRGRGIDLLITANALSLPMHFPLAVGLTRVIEELKLPAIARHHDFWWERKRFLKSTMFDFFKRWFPPGLPEVKHVVINSIAKKELEKRAGIDSVVIHDTFDFRQEKIKPDSYSRNWRKDFGIKKDDIVFLQATRIVPRKRIELSIELVKKLNHPKIVLVIAGQSGDEGRGYEIELRKAAKRQKVRALFIGKQINSERKIEMISGIGQKPRRRRVYTLWDCFLNCDFVTYPTRVEGFGNQFVEAVRFKKPIIMTPYKVYEADIKPFGFEVIEMPDRVSKKVIKRIKELMDNPKARRKVVEKNFRLGKKYFDYQVVEKKLKEVFGQMGLS